MPHFNASQQTAIDAKNPHILVSAAAGSGKTTVMVEKIKETLLQDPEASLAQFLVITFTRDAARNMKDKLRDLLESASLSGDARASRALSEIETASISTIHAFCTQLLAEFNDHTGASMTSRVLKDAEKKRLLDEAFTDASSVLLDTRGLLSPGDREAIGALLTAFSEEEVRKMTQDLYNVLMGIPDPFAFLERVVETLPCDAWNQEILASIELDLLGLEELLRQEDALMQSPEALPAYEVLLEEDQTLIERFLATFQDTKSAEEKRALIETLKGALAGAPRISKLSEEAKAWKKEMDGTRGDIKGSSGILSAALERLRIVLDEKNDRLNEIIRQELRGLELLLKETHAQYRQQKLDAGAIDYADMEQVAYRIMSDPDKRNELLARYRYIYVDECQDVSGIQDAIIRSLAGPGHSLFLVGDIKQSIYGFRHADPGLFEKRRQIYSDEDAAEERRIFFMDNYRSARKVVDAVNAVFSEAMDERITEMNYLPEDNLRCNLPGDFGPVDVVLVSNEENDTDRLEAQCEAAGKMIQSLVSGTPVPGEAGQYQYRDIVILLRAAKGSASTVAEHLKKMHIPALYEGAPDFLGLAEVKSFLSLLTVIDNLHNDEALVGALINPPFGFSEEELAAIRLEKAEHIPFYKAFLHCAKQREKPIGQRCARVKEQLDAWRERSEGMSVPDFVWWLMRDTGVYAIRGAYPDGRARQANLDALYQRAVDGQQAGNIRLSDFISDLREARETKVSDSDDHPIPGAGDNFVRIMTMHKSKGLEFPVVILLDLQKNIRRKRSDEKLRMNVSSSGDALGLYLPAIQRNRHTIMDSQGKEAFDLLTLRKNIAEDTRLLYVAMTRAQQKLILIGSVRAGDEALWMNQTPAARIWKTRSMLDMIMPAVLQKADLPKVGETSLRDCWRVSRLSGKAIEEETEAPDAFGLRIEEALTATGPSPMYIPEAVESYPLKTSVTTLSQQWRPLSEDDTTETLADKRKPDSTIRTFLLDPEPSRPAFLEEAAPEAIDIGTATHRFIRLINLALLRGENKNPDQVIREELHRMEAEQILTEEEARLIRVKGVISFFRSELGQRMLKSADVRREVDFTMRIAPDRPTMVQGIIDCTFREDDGWILIDYKTDYETSPDIFIPRHEIQMNWYRTALERLTRLPVREMWLFALRAGTAYPVKRIEVRKR